MLSSRLPEHVFADPQRLRQLVLKEYEGPDVGRDSFTRSFFGRNGDVTKRIDEIAPTLPDAPRVLFIGLGSCKYGTGTVGAGAVELGGILEAHGKLNFKMTVFDFDDGLLDRFVDQTVVKTRHDSNEGNSDQIRGYAKRIGAIVQERGA